MRVVPWQAGMGDRNAPRSLQPSPALLAFMMQRPITVEGGKQFDRQMPAFKPSWREDIWKDRRLYARQLPLGCCAATRQIAAALHNNT
jgi:hypothetical protein